MAWGMKKETNLKNILQNSDRRRLIGAEGEVESEHKLFWLGDTEREADSYGQGDKGMPQSM